MKRLLAIVAIGFLLVMVSIDTAGAPSSSRKKRSATTAKQAAEPPLKPFDTAVAHLPPNYTGASIQTAYRKFRVPPKGEFETSDEYAARVKKLPWGIYAFVVPKRFCQVTYDADTQLLSVVPTTVRPAIGFDEVDDAAVELARENERSRTYNASNAFGASITVEEFVYSSYSLITSVRYLPNLTITLDRARAATSKDNIRLLAIVGLDESSFIERGHNALGDSTGFRHAKPTFDDPTEITISDYSLRAQLLQLWVFNRATGEILGRFDTAGNAAS